MRPIRLPCPYYKNGMCTAVRDPSMARAVVMPYRCKSDYEKCEIYKKEEARHSGSQRARRQDRGRVRGLMVFVEASLTDDPPARCHYYDAGFCRLYNRFIPEQYRELCTDAEKCPLKPEGKGPSARPLQGVP
ncbi:MAG: hypothetical protein ACP5GO_05390 [Thermoprotei archaeon]